MNIIGNLKIARILGRAPSKSLLFCFLFSAFWFVLTSPVPVTAEPNRADIAKIYNIEKTAGQNIDVRYYRRGECEVNLDKWCVIRAEGGYLNPKDFLQTGEISRADLALVNTREQYNEILFWQQEGSRSKFLPKPGTCHFEVSTGGFLYAHPHQSVNPGCEKIIGKHASILPRGTVLFISGSEDETLVGVLSNQSGLPVIVNAGNQAIKVEAGHYVSSKANGKVTRGSFDLEEFYQNNPLVTGLGDEKKDDEYVARQEPAIRLILEKLRKETKKAAVEQKKLIAEGNWNDVNTPSYSQSPSADTGATDTGATTDTGTTDTVPTDTGTPTDSASVPPAVDPATGSTPISVNPSIFNDSVMLQPTATSSPIR